jgi:hypothetical protein
MLFTVLSAEGWGVLLYQLRDQVRRGLGTVMGAVRLL